MNKFLYFLLLVVIFLVIGGGIAWQRLARYPAAPSPLSLSPSVLLTSLSPASPSLAPLEVMADNLQIPWALGWLPDGTLLVTERPGKLLALTPDKQRVNIAIPDSVAHRGEGGLLGLAIHPGFAKNSFIYLYRTFLQENGQLRNRVERYRLVDRTLRDPLLIIDNIPGAPIHDGGALAFGPDKNLYITTGDAGQERAAQDLRSLAGKILRVRDDGSLPPDNPFGTAVYSYGHRNPQGLAWDTAGVLWATEHGRSGIRSGLDELNVIKAGNNYGWPVIEGDETQEGMIRSVINSGTQSTWAPAGIAFLSEAGRSGEGMIFFGGLRGEALYEATIRGEEVSEFREHYQGQFGRIRAVALGPDGFLYLTTSNTDGRGTPNQNDDKIIRIDPYILKQ